ncbi:class C beta-lactamase-related serine hydrolase [Candidatus Thorarchaeota archaeon]|nr:MAG: class C beta-lactamase-related serine hydrolase [Candidatus Thorarchaeota archaeon]
MDKSLEFAILCLSLMIVPMIVPSSAQQQSLVSQTDYWPTSGWISTTPEEQGMQSERLEAMEDYIDTQDWTNDIDSLLIIRYGYLVYESYPSPSYDENDRHHIYSCTKSFTSALIGTAIDDGYIDSVDTSVLDYFPELADEYTDSDKDSITIKHLLTMTSGLEWVDQSDYYNMASSTNWAKYVLDRQLIDTPGEEWNYNTGGTHLLSVILNRTTPEGTLEYAKSKIFTPLGISNYVWVTDNQGIPIGGTALNILPKDMAKFGYLYLMNGLWDDEQLISEDWISESTTTSVQIEFDQGQGTGYSYLWWNYAWGEAYTARGSYEQYIIIIPALDMVVVCTGSGSFTVTTLLLHYIFPAAGFSPSQNYLLMSVIIITSFAVVVIFGWIIRSRGKISKLNHVSNE